MKQRTEPARLKECLKRIRLLATDIDGVLTRGEIVILPTGEELKVWNVKDRMAVNLLRIANPLLKIAWITGRGCPEVEKQVKALGIDLFYQNIEQKEKVLDDFAQRLKIKPAEVAFIGDDLIDIPLLKKVGLAACPNDAVRDVREVVHYISPFRGGEGVFRDLVEVVLQGQGLWPRVLKYYDA